MTLSPEVVGQLELFADSFVHQFPIIARSVLPTADPDVNNRRELLDSAKMYQNSVQQVIAEIPHQERALSENPTQHMLTELIQDQGEFLDTLKTLSGDNPSDRDVLYWQYQTGYSEITGNGKYPYDDDRYWDYLKKVRDGKPAHWGHTVANDDYELKRLLRMHFDGINNILSEIVVDSVLGPFSDDERQKYKTALQTREMEMFSFFIDTISALDAAITYWEKKKAIKDYTGTEQEIDNMISYLKEINAKYNVALSKLEDQSRKIFDQVNAYLDSQPGNLPSQHLASATTRLAVPES